MAKNVIKPRVAILLAALVLGGKSIDAAADGGKCFYLESDAICINGGFESGDIIESGELSRVKVLVGGTRLFKKAVAYIERSENSRNDPGRALFQYAMDQRPNQLGELEDTVDYTLYKSVVSGRDNDYLFVTKSTSEYYVFSCAFVHVCSMQGSYRGALSVRLDFELSVDARSNLVDLFSEFQTIKEKLFDE